MPESHDIQRRLQEGRDQRRRRKAIRRAGSLIALALIVASAGFVESDSGAGLMLAIAIACVSGTTWWANQDDEARQRSLATAGLVGFGFQTIVLAGSAIIDLSGGERRGPGMPLMAGAIGMLLATTLLERSSTDDAEAP